MNSSNADRARFQAASAAGLLAGVALAPDYPELSDCFVAAVTEANLPEEIDRFAAVASELASTGALAAAGAAGGR